MFCFWNSSNVRLTDDGPLSSFQGRLSSTSVLFPSTLLSSRRSMVWCPWLNARQLLNTSDLPRCSLWYNRTGWRKTPTYLLTSKMQGMSVCSVISLHSGMSRAVYHRSLVSLRFPFRIFFFRILSNINILKTRDNFGACWAILVFP